jgi:RNA polymerase sigma factor (sigma-70 family)
MSAENELIDLAEQEYDYWLKGKKQKSKNEFSEILKSVFVTSRKELRSWLDSYCAKSIQYLEEPKPEIEKLEVPKEPAPVEKKTEEKDVFGPIFRRVKIDYSEETYRIIQGIRTGNQEIFNELYEKEFPSLVKFILQNKGSIDDAKDVFQDALVIIIEKAQLGTLNFNFQLGNYIFGICRILWKHKFRLDKRRVLLNLELLEEELSLGPDLYVTIAEKEKIPSNYQKFQQAYGQLGDQCKKLLELFYYERLSWHQIAKSIGYSDAASARNQKYKCLEMIRRKVNSHSL